MTAVRNTDAENLILLGDFNIFGKDDTTMAALLDAGFVVPQNLAGTNLDQKRHYDQIALYPRTHRFEATERAGVFNFYDVVFKADDEAAYAGLMGPAYAGKAAGAARSRFYKDWRTHQMSDHLVLWAELKIGWAEEYLAAL